MTEVKSDAYQPEVPKKKKYTYAEFSNTSDDDWADPTNRAFPIMTRKNTENSIYQFSKMINLYSPREQLYIIERLLDASVRFSLKTQLSDIIYMFPQDLQKRLGEAEQNTYYEFSSRIEFIDGNKFRGIAFAEGFWRHVHWSKDFVKSLERQVLGAPMWVEHGRFDKFINENGQPINVGKYTHVHYDDRFGALFVEGEITHPYALELYKQGWFGGLSIGVDSVKRKERGMIKAVRGTLNEISLVNKPVCEFCNIGPKFN